MLRQYQNPLSEMDTDIFPEMPLAMTCLPLKGRDLRRGISSKESIASTGHKMNHEPQ